MGSFNSLYMPCKKCGELVEFQTKAGDCSMTTLCMDTISMSEVEDLNGDSAVCRNCHEENTISFEYIVRPQVNAEVV